MSGPDLNVSGLMVLTAKHAGPDGWAFVHEEYIMGQPFSGIGSLMFPTTALMRAGEDGWVEVMSNEGRGVVCRLTEQGMDYVAPRIDDARQRTGR